MNNNEYDERLLKKLAAAMTANPRGTTQELSEMVGISRATFNRFCGTRENLVEVILKYAQQSLQEIINLAEKETINYNETLCELISMHFQNQEYLIFICDVQSSLENTFWSLYLRALDNFFLNGQKKGEFKLDFSNQMLSELFISMICGMIDAEHRGRIAAAEIENKIAVFFLNGAAEK
jgi:TetR/AcrR family transcriptional repressor of mexCD-oprJ operon